jgi:HK97 family phage major capsid protein
VPFRTNVARETGSGTGGSWVGEGLSTPVAATAYGTLIQEAYKAQVIVVLSNELLRLGDPASERTVRQTVTAGVTAYLDAQALTNTVTLVANTRTAAITNGATAVTSTGTTAEQINADLTGLLAAVTTPGPAGVGHAARDGLSHCSDHRWDRRRQCAALAVRDSAGAQCE